MPSNIDTLEQLQPNRAIHSRCDSPTAVKFFFDNLVIKEKPTPRIHHRCPALSATGRVNPGNTTAHYATPCAPCRRLTISPFPNRRTTFWKRVCPTSYSTTRSRDSKTRMPNLGSCGVNLPPQIRVRALKILARDEGNC